MSWKKFRHIGFIFALLILLANLLYAGTPPTANFNVDIAAPVTGQTITFTDASVNNSGTINNWSWSFGIGADPAIANSKGPHDVYYTSPGSKTASLTVSWPATVGLFGISAGSNTFSYTINVTCNNPTPTISPDPSSVIYGDTLSLNGSPSGGSGSYLTHVWTGTGAAFLSSIDIENPNFSGAPVGSYTLIYTVTDSYGCVGNDNITVNVTKKPLTVTADDQTKDCGELDPVLSYQISSGSLVSGDDFSGSLTRQSGESIGSYSILQGTLSLNSNYNLSYVAGTFVIDDNTAPVADVATLSDITAGCEVTSLTAPTATDNCTGLVTGATTTTLPITTQGTTVVTWTYDDGNGNTFTQTQNVIIDDVSNPTITCPSDINQSVDAGLCTASGILLGTPITGDNCSVASVTNDAPVTFLVGTTVVTWTVTDIAGNTATCPQNVVIVPEEDIDISVVALVDFCQSGQAGTTTVTWSVQLLAGTTDWTYDYTINDGSTDVASDTSVSATGNITISYTMNNGGNDKTFTLTITNVKDDCGISETGTTIHSEEVTVTAVPTTGEIIPD